MTHTEVSHIERLAKHELFKTDNYIDKGNKWLYNNRWENPYFALYSTHDENNPTVLYASKGARANLEYQFIKEYIQQEEKIYGKNLDGSTESIDRLLMFLEDAKSRRNVHNNDALGRGSNDGNVGIHSRNQRNRPSKALFNCLRNITETQEKDKIKNSDRDIPTVRSTLVDALDSISESEIDKQTLSKYRAMLDKKKNTTCNFGQVVFFIHKNE